MLGGNPGMFTYRIKIPGGPTTTFSVAVSVYAGAPEGDDLGRLATYIIGSSQIIDRSSESPDSNWRIR